MLEHVSVLSLLSVCRCASSAFRAARADTGICCAATGLACADNSSAAVHVLGSLCPWVGHPFLGRGAATGVTCAATGSGSAATGFFSAATGTRCAAVVHVLNCS